MKLIVGLLVSITAVTAQAGCSIYADLIAKEETRLEGAPDVFQEQIVKHLTRRRQSCLAEEPKRIAEEKESARLEKLNEEYRKNLLSATAQTHTTNLNRDKCYNIVSELRKLGAPVESFTDPRVRSHPGWIMRVLYRETGGTAGRTFIKGDKIIDINCEYPFNRMTIKTFDEDIADYKKYQVQQSKDKTEAKDLLKSKGIL